MGIGWTPGIGDPTAMGWFTVAAYFGAAMTCARAAVKARNLGQDSSKDHLFWVGAAAIFIVLGVNKQLDLQSLLTGLARSAAKAQNWYDERERYQTAFVGVVGLASVLILSSTLWRLRRSSGPVWLAILGLAFICGFVVMRAASFHHVDEWLAIRFLGMRWNWLVELTGIAIVTTAAMLYRRPDDRVRQ